MVPTGTRKLNLDACTIRERAMVDFSVALTRDPAAIDTDAVEMLRCAGLDDREIHDLVNSVAYFAYANRIVAGLGVRTGGREGAPGQ
eukprot:m.183638 g.183638  ORF g.183638 m.183638 type:complete len:87 (-) comp18482_c0_seq3:717-977(-)